MGDKLRFIHKTPYNHLNEYSQRINIFHVSYLKPDDAILRKITVHRYSYGPFIILSNASWIHPSCEAAHPHKVCPTRNAPIPRETGVLTKNTFSDKVNTI